MLRIPIARDGYGVLATTSLVLGGMGVLGSWWTPWIWVPLLCVWVWALSFFRDPGRGIDREADVLYSPADGTVTEVVELESHPSIPGGCIRIRIFLSIFNVHINRAPCDAQVSSVAHTPGRFMNALRPESAEVNESNTLVLDPAEPFGGPLVLRQIAGMIARRIVCHARGGDVLSRGQRFGMIKFGSGTELVFPRQAGLSIRVQKGDRVKAGLTVLADLRDA